MKKEAVVIAAILIATDLPLSADVSILPPRTPLRYGEGGLTDAGGGPTARARAQFSMDMTSEAVKRVEDVRVLRAAQVRAGPRPRRDG